MGHDINVNFKEMGLEDVKASAMDCREHGTELVDSMVGREFLEYLRPCQLRKGFVLWN